MSFLQILGFAFTGFAAVIVLRTLKPEYALLTNALLGVILSICAVSTLSPVISFLRTLGETGHAQGLFALLFKTCGITLLASMASDICRDAGEGALAGKIELCAKALCLSLSLPLLRAVWEAAYGLLA